MHDVFLVSNSLCNDFCYSTTPDEDSRKHLLDFLLMALLPLYIF